MLRNSNTNTKMPSQWRIGSVQGQMGIYRSISEFERCQVPFVVEASTIDSETSTCSLCSRRFPPLLASQNYQRLNSIRFAKHATNLHVPNEAIGRQGDQHRCADSFPFEAGRVQRHQGKGSIEVLAITPQGEIDWLRSRN